MIILDYLPEVVRESSHRRGNMQISATMNLDELGDLIEGERTWALWVRDALVISGYRQTEDVPADEWHSILETTALAAEERVHPSFGADMPLEDDDE